MTEIWGWSPCEMFHSFGRRWSLMQFNRGVLMNNQQTGRVLLMKHALVGSQKLCGMQCSTQPAVSHYEMCNLMGKSHKNQSLKFKEIADGGSEGCRAELLGIPCCLGADAQTAYTISSCVTPVYLLKSLGSLSSRCLAVWRGGCCFFFSPTEPSPCTQYQTAWLISMASSYKGSK